MDNLENTPQRFDPNRASTPNPSRLAANSTDIDTGQSQDLNMIEARRIARKVFGHLSLRPFQCEVLAPILVGRDTLAVLPTGAGKSLCYSLPAMMGEGIAVVISPLIALIRDQVLKLRKQNIAAASLDSMQTPEERRQVLTALADKRVKILFVSPERLALSSFKLMLDDQTVRLYAIDEAHCISQWGGSFRPEYRRIGEHLRDLARAPIMALTATATIEVRREIIDCLGMRSPAKILKIPTRRCLDISVWPQATAKGLVGHLLSAVKAQGGQGIIYGLTRKSVDQIYQALNDFGESACRYHAGLAPLERERSMKSFLEASTRIVVATNAFGLGVDKADIRFCYHAGLPQSIEQYVQEIGRAGRDGLTAQCRLFYLKRDIYIHKFMIDKEFVDSEILKKVWYCLLEALNSSSSISRSKVHHILGAELAFILNNKQEKRRQEIDSCLDCLCRENMIISDSLGVSSSRSSPRAPFSEPNYRLGKEAVDLDLFFTNYITRKKKNLSRLNSMVDLAGSGGNYAQLIQDYFEIQG